MTTKVWTFKDAVEMECNEFDPKGDVTLVLESYEGCVYDNEDDIDVEDDAKALGSLNNRPSEVLMRVSSRHLILASSVFEAMLSRGFQEDLQLQSSGKLRLPLPDDNSVAMSILLNIIHGRPSKVPRLVSLDLLAELAILVDKYELHEVVTMFSELWIGGIKDGKNLPTEINVEFAQWLCVSCVFAQEAEYFRMTEIAWRKCTSRMSHELLAVLPIPDAVVDEIEKRRLDAISGALEMVNSLIKDYQGPVTQCQHPSEAFNCDGMVLGGLIKKLSTVGLWPEPPAPYSGISFDFVNDSLRGIDIPKFCKQRRGYDISYYECRDYRHTIDDHLDFKAHAKVPFVIMRKRS